MNGFRFSAFAVVALALSPTLRADPIVDGTLDADFYGQALTTQNTQTAYGNNDDPSADFANGSELDQAYGRVSNGSLFLFLTGNLQTNYSQVEVFVDSTAGGQNTIQTGNANVDSGALDKLAGLTFDSGFSADRYIRLTAGGNPRALYADFATLPDNPADSQGTGFSGGPNSAGSAINASNGAQIALNNSNILGVNGGADEAVSPEGVLTGVEYEIPLAALGNPTGSINVSAFINDGSHTNVSNQVLGGLGGSENLGDPSQIDFNTIDGNQYFTVAVPAVPEPASLGLLGAGCLAMIGRRRRR